MTDSCSLLISCNTHLAQCYSSIWLNDTEGCSPLLPCIPQPCMGQPAMQCLSCLHFTVSYISESKHCKDRDLGLMFIFLASDAGQLGPHCLAGRIHSHQELSVPCTQGNRIAPSLLGCYPTCLYCAAELGLGAGQRCQDAPQQDSGRVHCRRCQGKWGCLQLLYVPSNTYN